VIAVWLCGEKQKQPDQVRLFCALRFEARGGKHPRDDQGAVAVTARLIVVVRSTF